MLVTDTLAVSPPLPQQLPAPTATAVSASWHHDSHPKQLSKNPQSPGPPPALCLLCYHVWPLNFMSCEKRQVMLLCAAQVHDIGPTAL